MKTIKGTLTITLSPIVIAPAKPPHTYFGVAQSLMPGLSVLAAAPNNATSVALTFIAAHILECLLKAYLSRDGSDDRFKNPKIRHNLSVLWAMASKEGLQIPELPHQWVDQLSSLHNSPYYLRYSTGVHGIVLPSTEPMVSELEALLATVRAQLK